MLETQEERIRRLGSSDLWYGQSDFYKPFETPALEHITMPAGYAGECAGCGAPFEFHRWGSLALATRAVVLHLGEGQYRVYHPACVPEVPWVHEQVERPAAAQAEDAGQLSLFGREEVERG